jgi:hypothetical protein
MEINILKEMADMSHKIIKSYETLNEINEIDIATSPKTEV